MAQFLKMMAVSAILFCVVSGAEVKNQGPSAHDTVAYINATLHKYPTLEFVNSGCTGDEQVVSISSDRRSIIIKQQVLTKPFQGKCESVQTLTAPIFNLSRDQLGSWSKQSQHTSFFLDCTNRVDCFSRRSDAQPSAEAENNWYLRMTAPDEVSRRLKKAIQHLVDTLLAEASARVDSNDGFAKHAK